MTVIKDMFCGKRVGFFGIGKSNLSLINVLNLEGADVTLRSDKAIDREKLPPKLKGCRIYDGKKAFDEMREELLFLSPSVRRDRRELSEACARGVRLCSDAELFFENAKAPIYAVTGSDGKSTTATLVTELLSAKHRAELVGNIGRPMFSSLSDSTDCYVTELSSFMLSYLTPQTRRAAVTNITPNHLDWHCSFEEYKAAKLSIFRGAKEKILSFDDEILRDYAKKNEVFGVTSTNYTFSELKRLVKAEVFLTLENGRIFLNGESLLAIRDVKRRETHNLKNLMTAIAMTFGETAPEGIRRVAANFGGLPHRCRLVLSRGGVDFYDSSIDSTPSRTAQTLTSLGRRTVVILGGRGKGVPYSELCPALALYAECAVICGECADDIYKDVKSACRTVMVDNFDDAVEFAAELSRSCGCVLLSPAATSYDAFENYEERGKRFGFLIENITNMK